jgi:hypothetical protein
MEDQTIWYMGDNWPSSTDGDKGEDDDLDGVQRRDCRNAAETGLEHVDNRGCRSQPDGGSGAVGEDGATSRGHLARTGPSRDRPTEQRSAPLGEARGRLDEYPRPPLPLIRDTSEKAWSDVRVAIGRSKRFLGDKIGKSRPTPP